jgi:dihydrofolate reductase
VTIIGAPNTARQCLKAGLADELHVDIMPVLLGDGLPLFETTGMEPVQLERLQVMELPGGRTHIRFRIIRNT